MMNIFDFRLGVSAAVLFLAFVLLFIPPANAEKWGSANNPSGMSQAEPTPTKKSQTEPTKAKKKKPKTPAEGTTPKTREHVLLREAPPKTGNSSKEPAETKTTPAAGGAN